MYSNRICSKSWRTGISRELAAFLIEVEHPLLAGVIQTAAMESSDGAVASRRVNQMATMARSRLLDQLLPSVV
jgi:hypothetical protein